MPAVPAPNAFKTVKRITLLIHQTYNTRMLNKQQPLQSISLPLSYILERAAQVAVVVVLQNSPSRARAPFNSARGKLLHCGAKNREWGLSAEKREMHCVRYRRRRARIGNNMTDSRNSLRWQRADLDVCAYTYAARAAWKYQFALRFGDLLAWWRGRFVDVKFAGDVCRGSSVEIFPRFWVTVFVG